MKTGLFSLFLYLITITSTLANQVQFQEGLWHDVVPDSLAKKGTIYIQTRETPEDYQYFQARFKYDFNYQFLFFKRNMAGEEVVDMPIRFQSEQGFIDLETGGTYTDERVTLYHKGRREWAPYYDCHYIRLVPKKSDKWEGHFIYCPDVPKSGISEMQLTVKKIPLLGEHTIVSQWRKGP
jgi:hypothetical protein